MKKYLIMLVGILSFVNISTVKADTYVTSNYYTNFDTYVNDYLTYKENIDYMINYWEENYSLNYPYYGVFEFIDGINTTIDETTFILYYSTSNKIINYDDGFRYYLVSDNIIGYNTEDNSYYYDNEPLAIINTTTGKANLLTSNGLIYDKYDSSFDNVSFPSYKSDTLNISIPEFEISTGDIFPTVISLYDGSYDIDFTSYLTVNLNQYPYIALTLKDYTKRDTFYANTYVKGQYCLTPVYNYGMTEKKDIIEGSKNQRCSTYYDDFTLVRTYILDQDLENNAIYYLKAYDTSKENIVKIDTSMFDITYITEETQDNPYVTIAGKTYPTISYDSLTDTATKSEDEDYISGVSCQVGDFNCYNQYNPGNIFNELFDKPLEMLKNIWSAITSIFDIIAEFISLLPEQMQTFLYLSFIIALILGLIKIIL